MANTFSSYISYLLSLIFGAGGSFCGASGLICMKIGNIKVENHPNRFMFLLQPLWWIGFLICACSICFNGCKFLPINDFYISPL